jgi:hypothetical protein
MRISSLTALALIVAGAAFADSSPQTATYVDGNVAGVAPKTGGTLLFAGDQTMNFRTGLANVAVPYSNITHAELGAVVETSRDVPLYKVWALHKRFGAKPQNQYLIVNFTNEEGEQKTMTLELAQAAAPEVLTIIQDHTGKTIAPARTEIASSNTRKSSSKVDPMKAGPEASGWWGDDIWKTTRNADKWGKNPPQSQPEQR